jgi:DNA-directed RNA polymerase subunit RPC12/RpoP
MAIYTTCSCGKTISARDELAGRRARCPKCGSEVAFPNMTPRAASSSDVFISHSKNDKTTADALCAALEAAGICCWIAPRDITPGKEWGEAIIDGISHCTVMLLIFSSNSNQSQQVRREVERAVAKEIVIIPLRIEDVPMTKAMEYFLSSPHWLDALTPPLESHLPKLVRTVKLLLEEKGRGLAATPVVPAKPVERDSPPASPQKTSWWPVALVLGLGSALLGVSLLVIAAVFLSRLWTPSSPNTIASSVVGAPKAASPGPAADPSNPVASNTSSPAPVVTSTGVAPETEKASVPPKENRANLAVGAAAPLVMMAQSAQAASRIEPAREVSLQTGGINIYSRKPPPEDSAAEKPVAAPGKSKRLILITNQRGSASQVPQVQSEAELSFQINNFTAQPVTLSRLQLHLLGIVQHYEDQIAEPVPPHVIKDIEDLEVVAGTPAKTVAEMVKVFGDEDTPFGDLTFTATSSQPELVQPAIVEGRLVLKITPTKSGQAYLRVEALDPFELSAAISFKVNVKGTEPLVTTGPEVAVEVLTPRASAFEKRLLTFENEVPIRAHEIEPNLDLGEVTLDHRLSQLETIGSCATGNLISGVGDVRRPNTIRPLTLRISTRLLVVPRYPAQSDTMVGFKNPRRKLAVKPPRLTGTWHILKLSAVTTTAAGLEQKLDIGNLIVLESLPAEPASGEGPSNDPPPVELSQGSFFPTASFPTRMAYDVLRLHEGTPAYRRAQLCQSVPSGFDAAQISPTCYFGDGGSPFRSKEYAPRFPATSHWPRTNLAESLLNIRKDLPDVFGELESAISNAAKSEATEAGTRARLAWLKKTLAAGNTGEQPTPGLVRVVVP